RPIVEAERGVPLGAGPRPVVGRVAGPLVEDLLVLGHPHPVVVLCLEVKSVHESPQSLARNNKFAFAAKARAAISIASENITTRNGNRVGFAACRRRGNVSAQHPRMTAITRFI